MHAFPVQMATKMATNNVGDKLGFPAESSAFRLRSHPPRLAIGPSRVRSAAVEVFLRFRRRLRSNILSTWAHFFIDGHIDRCFAARQLSGAGSGSWYERGCGKMRLLIVAKGGADPSWLNQRPGTNPVPNRAVDSFRKSEISDISVVVPPSITKV